VNASATAECFVVEWRAATGRVFNCLESINLVLERKVLFNIRSQTHSHVMTACGGLTLVVDATFSGGSESLL